MNQHERLVLFPCPFGFKSEWRLNRFVGRFAFRAAEVFAILTDSADEEAAMVESCQRKTRKRLHHIGTEPIAIVRLHPLGVCRKWVVVECGGNIGVVLIE